MAAFKFFFEITQTKVIFLIASIVKGAASGLKTISGNWKPFKKHEKCILFHINELNLLLANQVLHILCILNKPNVWYS